MYIAISKDEGETEEVLTKRLTIFSKIFTMLYGPVDYKYVDEEMREEEDVVCVYVVCVLGGGGGR